MNNSIFRKKTVERVSSPEQLNDYIRVTSPRVWIVITATLVLLAGMFIWGIFGTVEMKNDDGTLQEVHPITFVIN